MVSDDTYMARTAAELYSQHAYPPTWVAVADVKAAILPDTYIGTGREAESAIERTALDATSPVEYVRHTGRSALTLEHGSRADVNARLKDWINRHDPSELPSGLK